MYNNLLLSETFVIIFNISQHICYNKDMISEYLIENHFIGLLLIINRILLIYYN